MYGQLSQFVVLHAPHDDDDALRVTPRDDDGSLPHDDGSLPDDDAEALRGDGARVLRGDDDVLPHGDAHLAV